MIGNTAEVLAETGANLELKGWGRRTGKTITGTLLSFIGRQSDERQIQMTGGGLRPPSLAPEQRCRFYPQTWTRFVP
jgi:hypothetical protein